MCSFVLYNTRTGLRVLLRSFRFGRLYKPTGRNRFLAVVRRAMSLTTGLSVIRSSETNKAVLARSSKRSTWTGGPQIHTLVLEGHHHPRVRATSRCVLLKGRDTTHQANTSSDPVVRGEETSENEKHVKLFSTPVEATVSFSKGEETWQPLNSLRTP
jgi:hypothetical protein